MIDDIIEVRSKGNPAIKEMTIAKLILKGFNPKNFDHNSDDDEVIIEKLINIAKQLNVKKFEHKGINIKTVVSTKSLEDDVVADIQNQLNIINAKIIVFFASSSFDQEKISKLMQDAFNDCVVVGCSTAGEIISGEFLKNSVVVMAINSNIVSDVKVEVIENIKENFSIEKSVNSFEEYYNESLYSMDAEKFIGITLIDGLCMQEERIMDLIGNRTNVFFVGGTAADDNKFLKTYVSANGKAYNDSAVLILLKINENAEFSVIKTQSFKALEHSFIANKVDEKNRQVIELNNKPAILAYADAIGVSSIEEATKRFMTNPLGLVVGENDIFVRSPRQVRDTSMIFYCNILEGMEVNLLEATNIIEDTEKAIKDKISEFGEIDGIINFQCTHRTEELDKKNLSKEFTEIFRGIPNVGFSAYGEQFIGHMNHTSAMLAFRLKTNTTHV